MNMDLVKESVKKLLENCSDLNISEGDRIVIFGGDLYKEIYNCPGYYVSVEGKVLGPRGNLIKLEEHYTGYYKVHLRETKSFVHRLVMLTFRWKDGCEDLVVNHKDLDKKNNHIDNLEWASHMENSRHYQAFSFKEKITEEVKDKIMALPSGFTREDLDAIFRDI
jgi:hypothetical protein